MIRATHQTLTTHSIGNPNNGWTEVQKQVLNVTFTVEMEPNFEHRYPKRDNTPVMVEPDVLEVRYEWEAEKGWTFGHADLSGYMIKANGQPGMVRRNNESWRPSGEPRGQWPQRFIDVIVASMPRGSYFSVQT